MYGQCETCPASFCCHLSQAWRVSAWDGGRWRHLGSLLLMLGRETQSRGDGVWGMKRLNREQHPQLFRPRRAGSSLWRRVSAGPVPDPLQTCDKAEDELIFLWVNYLCNE